ncbi:MAG: C40 family peptidase [Alphaproteobacteria bacterium]|nr:C40 family peptidase [Alphaproteobacteria bacterium]MDE2164106.1 C40 family peptidase [Alphaproteobacteria bacterium]
METKESPPPCGETGERSDPGGRPTSQIVSLARAWIGTAYVHQASVKGAGCDCLGLLRGVWRELRGDEPESPPPYSPDWAEVRGTETLHDALARHLRAVTLDELQPGDVALFRMVARGPAKHCAIVGVRDGALTLIHARQNKRVGEEVFTPAWRRKLAYAFRL